MMNSKTQAQFDNVHVGDILVGCFSYSMTFYDFYEVKGKTKCSLRLQKLGKQFIEDPVIGHKAAPDRAKLEGKPMTRRVDCCGCLYENGIHSERISLTNKYDPNQTYIEDNWD